MLTLSERCDRLLLDLKEHVVVSDETVGRLVVDLIESRQTLFALASRALAAGEVQQARAERAERRAAGYREAAKRLRTEVRALRAFPNPLMGPR